MLVNTIITRNDSALYHVTHNSTHDKGRVIFLHKLMLTPPPSLPHPQWKQKKFSYLMDYHAQFRLRSSKQLTQITQMVWIC